MIRLNGFPDGLFFGVHSDAYLLTLVHYHIIYRYLVKTNFQRLHQDTFELIEEIFSLLVKLRSREPRDYRWHPKVARFQHLLEIRRIFTHETSIDLDDLQQVSTKVAVDPNRGLVWQKNP